MVQDLNFLKQLVLSHIDPEEVIDFLRTLIRQPSDYPPGDCRKALEVVEEKLIQAKIQPRFYARQPHQPNLLASYPVIREGQRLMFHSHIDTVPPGELDDWTFDPFEGVIHERRIYGRGAGDDKSSVAAQVMSIIALKRSGIHLNGHLRLAIVSDEESGGLQGTQWLHREGLLGTDALVVGEQTNNQIAVSERVACGIDLTVYGKSAHGAMPWTGENAVLKMAGAITWLKRRLLPKLEQRKHPYLPPPTLNFGKICGGEQWNIVPDRCKVKMDRRLLPDETREMAMNEIRKALDDYSIEVESLRYQLSSTGEVAANINTPPDDPFVQSAVQVLADLTKQNRSISGYEQTSDGRWFARDGIPIIIFGPSDPAVAHSGDEYVSVEQLIEATRFLSLLALEWLQPFGSKARK